MLYNMEICWNTITFYNLQYLQYLNKCDGHNVWICYTGAFFLGIMQYYVVRWLSRMITTAENQI